MQYDIPVTIEYARTGTKALQNNDTGTANTVCEWITETDHFTVTEINHTPVSTSDGQNRQVTVEGIITVDTDEHFIGRHRFMEHETCVKGDLELCVRGRTYDAITTRDSISLSAITTELPDAVCEHLNCFNDPNHTLSNESPVIVRGETDMDKNGGSALETAQHPVEDLDDRGLVLEETSVTEKIAESTVLVVDELISNIRDEHEAELLSNALWDIVVEYGDTVSVVNEDLTPEHVNTAIEFLENVIDGDKEFPRPENRAGNNLRATLKLHQSDLQIPVNSK